MDDIRARLEERLATLEQRLGRIKDSRRSLLPPDSEDQAQALSSHEVVDALDDAARAEIAGLRAALGRLATGQYGACEVCGEPIPAGRLAAMPLTTRCIDHADR